LGCPSGVRHSLTTARSVSRTGNRFGVKPRAWCAASAFFGSQRLDSARSAQEPRVVAGRADELHAERKGVLAREQLGQSDAAPENSAKQSPAK
jgi:hypothetical protein